ncbi:hypothetical protein G647_05060 [Cladophialophora carrionii CBS 160.54]|uniref:Heterokaryon incompatibility domain-containing protein n=1 Tax=Cladophialophora carrionii CBS 160.54 TaxID=1279043 RepID=V9D986_9EURO|nr:uncharacterized protein G647_05060 [Cladophialophora carrionii CBS 160.54]ETI23261.1 hypothetical protein G647_05060 [Cladophialophora carrionii CBS 160.54]
MSRQYTHVPLSSPRHIRVVVLRPAENLAAPLDFCIVETSLDQPLPYSAVSYAWDAPSGSTELNCGNGSLLVTPNCEAALRYLRGKTATRRLWIDSICIDQTENAMGERNHQVFLMGEIFKKADGVLIWLGEMDEDTRIAMVAVDNVIKQPKLGETLTDPSARPQALSTQTRYKAADFLSLIFKRSWFHRMWTIQEALLQHVDRVIVQCGNTTIRWIYLLGVAFAMDGAEAGWTPCARTVLVHGRLLTSLIHLDRERYERALPESATVLEPSAESEPRAEGFHFPISVIFDDAKGKLATDPKDKVFALYGMFQEFQIAIPSPDYNKPMQEIYKESAIASIKNDKDLSILYYVPSASRHPGLASWVPDWSQPGWEAAGSRFCFRRDHFDTAKNTSGRWRFSPDSNHLIVSARIFDSVVFRLEGLTKGNRLSKKLCDGNVYDLITTTGKEWVRMLDAYRETFEIMTRWVKSTHGNCYPTGEDLQEALQRTLLFDTPALISLVANCDAFKPWFRAATASDLEFVRMGVENINTTQPNQPYSVGEAFLKACLEALTPSQLFSMVLESIRWFQLVAIFHCHHKCFFHTKKGYFGLAPDSLPTPISPGDVIAVVQGMEMPFLLRPVDGGYKLLSHVYVHGIMYGEAWPDDANEVEDLVLI